MNFTEFKKHLNDNPEIGRCLYEYLEDRRDQMLSQPWYSPDKYLGTDARQSHSSLQQT